MDQEYRVIAYCVTNEGSVCSLSLMISTSSPLSAVASGILFFSVLLKIIKFMQKCVPVCYRGSKDAVSRRHDVRVGCHHG